MADFAGLRHPVELDIVRMCVGVVKRIGKRHGGYRGTIQNKHSKKNGAYQSVGSPVAALTHVRFSPLTRFHCAVSESALRQFVMKRDVRAQWCQC